MKPFASAKRRSNAGFTLIETLAALAIAGAVFAVIAEFAGRTLRNWHHGGSTIAVMEMLTRGLGRMETDLASAVPMSPPGSDGATVYFTGDASKLSFVSATGFGVGNRGLEMVNIAATQDNDDVLVVRRRGPVLNPPAPMRDPVVLLQGRIQVRFAYRDAEGKTFKTWEARPDLPAAVLVQVLGQDGAPVFPSAFVLPVPVSLAADCLPGVNQAQGAPPRCGNIAQNNGAQGNAPSNNAPGNTAATQQGQPPRVTR